jgi:methylenetetrahydrofolate dehydrogenase (NADP+) / methenyltetrahydrofolate cyclohydrolase
MIIDGRALAASMYRQVAEEISLRPVPPKLAIVTCDPAPATKQYLELKRRKAKAVGISLTIIELPRTATTAETVTTVQKAVGIADGVVVQLPLPPHIDREAVLACIPATHDPDGFSYGHAASSALPPVVAAIDIIASQYDVSCNGKSVAVVGFGRLVGQPAAAYAQLHGGEVTVVTEDTIDPLAILKSADIIISGVGKPHFITAEMVKEGVVIFDAGASEDGGVVVGDVHPDVSKRATLFTSAWRDWPYYGCSLV